MEDKFYTINQVAEILDMHHKTIRNFIAERKLRASKVGKQWRISDEDLDSFMAHNRGQTGSDEVIEFFANELASSFSSINKSIGEGGIANMPVSSNKKISVSTVLDIEHIDKEDYQRISNTLIAVINGREGELQKSTINMKYYEREHKCKILLWGNISFIEEILGTVSLLLETSNL